MKSINQMNSYNPASYQDPANGYQHSAGGPQNLPKIRVVVRKRPLTTKERKKGDVDVLTVTSAKALIVKEFK